MSEPAITLHGTELSGHAHRVVLLLRMLGLPYRFVAAPAEARRSEDHPTIADLACYSYVAHAPEGGISLDGYSSVRAWLRRIEGLPQFVPMPGCPVPQA